MIDMGGIHSVPFATRDLGFFVSRPKRNEDSDVISNSFCVDLSLKVDFKRLGII